MPDKQKPETEFRVGGVRATVWSNERKRQDGKSFVVYNTNITRRYYNENKKTWEETNSFPTQDLPKVNLVAMKAFEFISLKERDTRSDSE